MKKNVGKLDASIRIILSLVFLSMLFWVEGNARYFGLIGIIPLATAYMNFCPLYAVLGKSTVVKEGMEKDR